MRLLGRLELSIDDGTPVRLSTRKAGALIAYLAMAPDQSASREKLATLLRQDHDGVAMTRHADGLDEALFAKVPKVR